MALTQKTRSNEYRTTVLCIDSYAGRILTGRLYGALHPEGEHFTGWMQFLRKMEHSLNKLDFPQAFSTLRTFTQPPTPMAKSPPGPEHPEGRLATFELKVLFRQNSSWQGCITWLEEEREESFRSVLELSLLIDSAFPAEPDTENSA